MSLTTMACFVWPRRRGLADLCLWGGGLSRCTAGVGEWILGSEKDTSSPNHDGCILRFDVLLQDVCGNVHLLCSICSDIFLLASRYNNNNKKDRKEIRFQRKLYYLNNEDPHYKVGPKEGTQEKGGWSCLLYSLSVQPAREQGLETIQGMPRGLKWGRVDRLPSQSPYSHQRQA